MIASQYYGQCIFARIHVPVRNIPKFSEGIMQPIRSATTQKEKNRLKQLWETAGFVETSDRDGSIDFTFDIKTFAVNATQA